MSGYEEFGRGGVYKFFSDDRSQHINFFGVRKEVSPSDGVEYATFFTLVHDRNASTNMKSFNFRREKIPLDVLKIKNGELLTYGSYIKTTRIEYDERKEEREEIVESWLEECARILEAWRVPNVEGIFRGERTWERGDFTDSILKK